MKNPLMNMILGIVFGIQLAGASFAADGVPLSEAAPLEAAFPAPLKSTTVEIQGAKVVIATNAQGLTLYTFDRDKSGVSNCYSSCAVEWPPLLIDANQQVQAPLSVITRRDQTHQLAINGKPLYTYDDDVSPGDITGNGIGGVWHVVRAQ